MPYDLDMIEELSREIGLAARRGDQRVEIDLGEGAVLWFQNLEPERESLIGFPDTPWHEHGKLIFVDGCGNRLDVDQLDLLIGLKDGHILVCEQRTEDRVVARWLVHDRYNNIGLEYMKQGERIVVRRAMTISPG